MQKKLSQFLNCSRPILDRIYAWTSTYLKEELVNGLILERVYRQSLFLFLDKSSGISSANAFIYVVISNKTFIIFLQKKM